MRYRPLGKTGLKVSEVGYGAWGVGGGMWMGADDEESLRSLRAARDAGVNFFDTALVYGDGHSEQLIAQCFGDAKDVVIATKVPPKDRVWGVMPGTPLQQTFPRDYVLASLDESLRNLGRDSVDIYQFHTWTDDWADDPEWQRTVSDLKSSGKVKCVGISVRNHQPGNVVEALKTGLVDTVQVIYNIFDQSPEDKLFSFCQKNRIGVIVRVPFDEGSLVGAIRPETEFPEGDFRNMYFAGERKKVVWERVQAIVSDLDISVEQLPEIALRFCLSHPAVSTVIAGMRKTKHVGSNIDASNLGPLPEEMMNQLRHHRWDRPDFWS